MIRVQTPRLTCAREALDLMTPMGIGEPMVLSIILTLTVVVFVLESVNPAQGPVAGAFGAVFFFGWTCWHWWSRLLH